MTDAYKTAMADAAQAYADAVASAAKLGESSSDKIPSPKPEASLSEQRRPEFNSAAFYDEIRESLFGGSLTQSQVDGHNILCMACSFAGLDPVLEQSAYVLATAYHETAQTMQPIEEYGGWNTSYASWFGRGFVQLTWEDNYEKQQSKLDAIPQVHQYNIPYQVHDDCNLALDPRTSAIITVGGMRDGDFTGMKRSDYIKLVRLYRQRMQIEESFRDMKSQHFGEGLECSRSSGTGRFTVLVLIASLAAFVLWLLGSAAERCGLDRRMHPGNGKRRAYSRLFLARLLLVLESCRDVLDELVSSIGPPDQWVASDHDALVAG